METLIIRQTTKTPFIKFDVQKGQLEIVGKSNPEDAIVFYAPLKKYLTRYISVNASLPTQIDIYFTYFNTASLKCLLDIFRLIETFYYRGNKVIVNWYYEKDNDNMYKAGEDFKEIITLPLNLCAKQIELELVK
jgi:hypothetical protein